MGITPWPGGEREKAYIVGASLSEPHTSGTALRTCVCMSVCRFACGHIP